jgi:hypothetical protein
MNNAYTLFFRASHHYSSLKARILNAGWHKSTLNKLCIEWTGKFISKLDQKSEQYKTTCSGAEQI